MKLETFSSFLPDASERAVGSRALVPSGPDAGVWVVFRGPPVHDGTGEVRREMSWVPCRSPETEKILEALDVAKSALYAAGALDGCRSGGPGPTPLADWMLKWACVVRRFTHDVPRPRSLEPTRDELVEALAAARSGDTSKWAPRDIDALLRRCRGAVVPS